MMSEVKTLYSGTPIKRVAQATLPQAVFSPPPDGLDSDVGAPRFLHKSIKGDEPKEISLPHLEHILLLNKTDEEHRH